MIVGTLTATPTEVDYCLLTSLDDESGARSVAFPWLTANDSQSVTDSVTGSTSGSALCHSQTQRP